MSVPESLNQQVFEFGISKDKEVAHIGFMPPEIQLALNGLQIGAQRIQKDHIGYPQFISFGVEELARAAEGAEKTEVAEWARAYADKRNNSEEYMPEDQREVVFFPISAGRLVEIHTVE